MKFTMKRNKIIPILLCLLSLSLPVFAQDVSTQGKEFWLSFMGNGYRTFNSSYIYTQVLISGKRDCSGTIINPNTGYEQGFNVMANQITSIDLPESQGYVQTSEYEVVVNRGLQIITTDTVSVFCTNIADPSFDASFVLPIQALADDYIIQSYDQSTIDNSGDVGPFLTSAFLIIATEDNTTIDITPTVNSYSGQHHANEEYSITLNAGEVYQFRSTINGNMRDLSGSHVTARDCKKIAVFNGNTLTAIPTNRTSRDIVYEQAMPLQSWGKNFVVTSSYSRNEDYVKITSSADDNAIYKNGELLFMLNAGESEIFMLSNEESSCFIETVYPAAVFLYNTSYVSNSNKLGDPSMVWIAPVEQRIDEITFTTFHNSYYADIDNHYVNIIIKTEDINKVYLDNEQLSPLLFHRVNGNTDYSYIQYEITHDVHTLSCVNGFNAHVYGFGEAKGYAYLVGSKATNLIATLVINDVIVQPNTTFQYCIEEPVTFSAEINYQNYQLEWDFGDGSPVSHDNPVQHTYHDKRIYRPTLVINTDASGCTSANSDTTAFFIDVTQKYVDNEYADVCSGEYFSGYGFNNVLITNDTILGCLQDNPNNPNCPDSMLVYITTWPKYENIHINDSRCWSGEPDYYSEHGFSFPIPAPGTYNPDPLVLQTVHGCDSIVTLTLEVGDFEIHDTETHYLCYDGTPSFTWAVNNQTYHADGFYADTLPSGDCYAIYRLELHFLPIPEETHLYDTTCSAYDWEISGQTYHLEQSGNYPHYDDLAPFPCVKTTWLHLTIAGSTENPIPDVITTCDSIVWNGQIYKETNSYTTVLQTPLGCDSIVHLNLTIRHTPAPSNIRIPDDPYNYHDGDTIPVITNTEFFSFNYDFYVEDLNAHMDEWDSCVWHITKESWQIAPTPVDNPIQPNCRVYVADHDDNPVKLTCTIYNSHCEPYSITRNFYLKSSFFDIDEHETDRARFDIAPNPNNGQMQLHFKHLTGKVNIKVFDMHGARIDEFETEIPTEDYHYSYLMKQLGAGIYYFVVTGKEKQLTQKAVIIK